MEFGQNPAAKFIIFGRGDPANVLSGLRHEIDIPQIYSF